MGRRRARSCKWRRIWYRHAEAGVDTDKIEAAFKNGVLNVTLPKKPEAQKPAKNIEVKAA